MVSFERNEKREAQTKSRRTMNSRSRSRETPRYLFQDPLLPPICSLALGIGLDQARKNLNDGFVGREIVVTRGEGRKENDEREEVS